MHTFSLLIGVLVLAMNVFLAIAALRRYVATRFVYAAVLGSDESAHCMLTLDTEHAAAWHRAGFSVRAVPSTRYQQETLAAIARSDKGGKGELVVDRRLGKVAL